MGFGRLVSRRLLSSAAAAAAAPLPARMAGQVAVVTGGAGGIGRESSLLFAQHGAQVVVADMNEAGAAETVAMIDKQHGRGRAVALKVDVSKQADCKAMVDLAENKFGKLTVLFNNAGIMHSDDDNAMTTEEKVWDLTMNINVKGVFFGCKYGIPAMLRAGTGSIINTASFVGTLGAATPQLAYTSSKGAVLAMTRELAAIHARQNIRVNNLCPGPLNTPLLQKFLDNDAKRQRRLVHVPMGRFGEAKEMANMALFLASTESSYVTGASFYVDGGITSTYVTPDQKTDPFGGPKFPGL